MEDTKLNRIELIDHTSCQECNGKGVIVAENYKLSGHICKSCNGMGSAGRTVIIGGPAYGHPDNKDIKLSYQDDGRTLKIFVSDKQ